MKKFILLIIIVSSLSCKKETPTQEKEFTILTRGKQINTTWINDKEVYNGFELDYTYKAKLKKGESIKVRVTADCRPNYYLDVMIRIKDYNDIVYEETKQCDLTHTFKYE